MSDYPTRVLENILSAIGEDKRLQSLTNEELVREYLKLRGEGDEQHVEEMLTRLWPGWDVAEL